MSLWMEDDRMTNSDARFVMFALGMMAGSDEEHGEHVVTWDSGRLFLLTRLPLWQLLAIRQMLERLEIIVALPRESENEPERFRLRPV